MQFKLNLNWIAPVRFSVVMRMSLNGSEDSQLLLDCSSRFHDDFVNNECQMFSKQTECMFNSINVSL